MPNLGHEVEPCYMNALSFSLRPVAIELYNYHLLKTVMEVRLGRIPQNLLERFDLSDAQWQEVCDAVIVTKLTQLSLSSQLTPKCTLYLQKLLKQTLGMSERSLDDVYQSVHAQAPALGQWIRRLQKLSSR
ncbi:hypothetical protein AVO42_04430 [Thiomicrospira sp. XS5]|uniref:hypothetical protein n=1 Tax=Thiomicrospira sp. XS5 TaxID=1775636 RepID=UPI00074AD809|nr:hypothetical protein [Thiomicrospira sp. XS5]KUJ74647.1 hypothetical protein AVO42_04430 [Thiomicrospira sp. XS5]